MLFFFVLSADGTRRNNEEQSHCLCFPCASALWLSLQPQPRSAHIPVFCGASQASRAFAGYEVGVCLLTLFVSRGRHMAELMSHSSSVTLLSRGSSSAPSSTLSLFEMEEAWHNRATCLLTPELSDKTENVFSKALHRFLSLRVLLLVFGESRWNCSENCFQCCADLFFFSGCLFVLASGLVVFGICLAAGTSSVALTEASLQRSIAVSIVNEVISFLTTAYTGVNELGEQLRLSALRGYLSIRDTNATRIREVMLPIVRQFVPSLYIGFPTGYFVGYNNIGSANGEFVLTQSLFVGAPNRTRYFTDPLGEPLANIPNSTAMFNSSLRPWYRQCAQAKAPRFTDVYTFANIAVRKLLFLICVFLSNICSLWASRRRSPFLRICSLLRFTAWTCRRTSVLLRQFRIIEPSAVLLVQTCRCCI